MIYRDRKKKSEAICRILVVYSLKEMRFCYGKQSQYRVIQ